MRERKEADDDTHALSRYKREAFGAPRARDGAPMYVLHLYLR